MDGNLLPRAGPGCHDEPVRDWVGAEWFIFPVMGIVVVPPGALLAGGFLAGEMWPRLKWPFVGVGVVLSVVWIGLFVVWLDHNPQCGEDGRPPAGKTWCHHWDGDFETGPG